MQSINDTLKDNQAKKLGMTIDQVRGFYNINCSQYYKWKQDFLCNNNYKSKKDDMVVCGNEQCRSFICHDFFAQEFARNLCILPAFHLLTKIPCPFCWHKDGYPVDGKPLNPLFQLNLTDHVKRGVGAVSERLKKMSFSFLSTANPLI